jgi:restriction system protein
MGSKKAKGPVFLRFVAPIVEALKELGNSGTAAEVTDRVLERLNISDDEQEDTVSNGQARVRNQIGWARFYLAKAGLLDASQRGVWALTEAGRNAKLDGESTYALFKSVHKQFPRKAPSDDGGTVDAEGEQVDDLPIEDTTSYRAQLLTKLRSLPAAGFERVCQRLLRESGFQQVVVTGRSGDGGIDGHGVLEVNPLVTFKLLFQCKRYKDGSTVTPSQVRDFRGAMQGRADKGLILTTSSFTAEARKEATRDGVPPIELVDAEKLITMFERAGLGLRPKQTFEIDDAFFAEFEK